MMDNLHKESFEACLDTDFQVVLPEAAGFNLKLIEVIGPGMTARQETFSVIFHGQAEHFLQQGIVNLKHEKLGELGLFLVPIAKDKDGFQYEAVFNRLIASE
jgi:hypothetical protein